MCITHNTSVRSPGPENYHSLISRGLYINFKKKFKSKSSKQICIPSLLSLIDRDPKHSNLEFSKDTFITKSVEGHENHQLNTARSDSKCFDQLEKEKREQEVSCWNAVVKLMRDFLEAYEAYEQAKAKSMLLAGDLK